MDDFGWGSRWEAEWEAYRVTGQRRAEAAGPAWLRSKKHPSSAQKAHLVRDDNEKHKAKATAKDARLRRPLQVTDGAERGFAHDGRCALVTLRGSASGATLGTPISPVIARRERRRPGIGLGRGRYRRGGLL